MANGWPAILNSLNINRKYECYVKHDSVMVCGRGYRVMSSILICQYNPFVVPNNMNYKTHGYNGTNLSITVSTDRERIGKTIKIIKKKLIIYKRSMQ